MFGNRSKKSATCTAEDARLLLLLCLGREPYLPAELDTYTDQSFFGALKRTLRSAAFTHTVLDPFVIGKRPMELAFNNEARQLIEQGLSQHFGINNETASSGRWPAILLEALSAQRFQKAFLAEKGPDRLLFLRERLKEVCAQGGEAIRGAVHQTAGLQVRGVAFALDDSEPLTLDFYLDGLPAGSCVANRLNREIGESLGRDGYVGFSHTLAPINGGGLGPSAVLSVYDRETSIMACPPIEMVTNVRPAGAILERMVDELDALRQARIQGPFSEIFEIVSRLEAQLPRLSQFAAMRLEDYDIYRRTFRPGPPPTLGGDAPEIMVTIQGSNKAAVNLTKSSLADQSYQHFHIAEGTEAIYLASADIVVPLRAGDILDPNALGWFAACLQDHPEAQIVRTGRDYYDDNGVHCDPRFVSEFDPLVLAQNLDYASAFAVRAVAMDGLADLKDPQALWQRILEENGTNAFFTLDEMLITSPVTATLHEPRPLPLPSADMESKLAIIIPTKDSLGLIKNCVVSLQDTLKHTNNTEIIIVDNGSTEQATIDWFSEIDGSDNPAVRVLRHDAPFNWSELNNTAAASTDADYLLFLNNDTLAFEGGWDLRLRQLLAMPNAGVIGARLLYSDETIQHAGIVLNDNSLAFHEGSGMPRDAQGYENRLQLTRRVEAVTGAFLACPRTLFEELGGFDADNFAVTFNDVDFCLRAAATGKQVVYSPLVTFYHLESLSRGYDGANAEKAERARVEHERLRAKWADRLMADRWHPWRLHADSGTAIPLLKRPVRQTGRANTG